LRIPSASRFSPLPLHDALPLSRRVVTLPPPADAAAFPAVAPLPELRKMPGRFYPINYLFIEITNACNFKCTWCPDDIMGRRRGLDRKSTRLNSSHQIISYAVFC